MSWFSHDESPFHKTYSYARDRLPLASSPYDHVNIKVLCGCIEAFKNLSCEAIACIQRHIMWDTWDKKGFHCKTWLLNRRARPTCRVENGGLKRIRLGTAGAGWDEILVPGSASLPGVNLPQEVLTPHISLRFRSQDVRVGRRVGPPIYRRAARTRCIVDSAAIPDYFGDWRSCQHW